MKVRLFRRDIVEEFAEGHGNGKKLFIAWLQVIKYADWNEPGDITVSVKGNLLGNGSDRVVFDIGGNGRNAFRVICTYIFNCPYRNETKVHLYVNWIGTHEEYNALTNQQKLSIALYWILIR